MNENVTREECEACIRWWEDSDAKGFLIPIKQRSVAIARAHLALLDDYESDREFKELKQELEELRRDKERLDWLDSLPDQSEFTPAEYGTNIREAIDAAISENARND